MTLPFDRASCPDVNSAEILIQGNSPCERMDYRMIDTIEIQNFRCFESIRLSDCRRINLVVGRNASGKTALLETIFIASGASPEIGLRLKGWRSSEQGVALTADQSSYENLWKDLFYKFDQGKTISIQFVGSSGFGRSLRILYESGPTFRLPLGENAQVIQTITPIVFIYMDENGKEYKVSPIIVQGSLNWGTAELLPMRSSFLATQASLFPQQYANYFSTLSKQKKHQSIVEPLRTEFTFVKGIRVEIGNSMLPALYAEVDDLPELIPVTLLSYGVNKLLCILLSIALLPNGIIIIDEVENGFYFDRLPSIWSLILRFASEYDVQVFASTHSRECLEAAADVAEKHPDKFGIIRTVNTKLQPKR